METILLATDGSDHARTATEVAVERAADSGATLHAISVVDERRVEEPALGTAALSTVYAEESAQDCMSDIRQRADEADVPVESVIRRGVPHEVIIGYADDIDADVIIVGAHGDHADHFSGVGENVRRNSKRRVLVATE